MSHEIDLSTPTYGAGEMMNYDLNGAVPSRKELRGAGGASAVVSSPGASGTASTTRSGRAQRWSLSVVMAAVFASVLAMTAAAPPAATFALWHDTLPFNLGGATLVREVEPNQCIPRPEFFGSTITNPSNSSVAIHINDFTIPEGYYVWIEVGPQTNWTHTYLRFTDAGGTRPAGLPSNEDPPMGTSIDIPSEGLAGERSGTVSVAARRGTGPGAPGFYFYLHIGVNYPISNGHLYFVIPHIEP